MRTPNQGAPKTLPSRALAHLEMARPYTMAHPGLVAIMGALLASQGHIAVWRVTLAGLVAICGWEAGLYAGDYYDRELDARSKPERAIPSGRVSPREAFLTMLALIAVGYACALALGIANLALAVLTTALGIAYSKTFKSRAILGNLDRGILGVCAVLFGALAAGNVVTPVVLIAVLLIFAHDSSTNLVGAMRDAEGDRAAGYETVPVVYGQARAATIATALACCWVALGGALLVMLQPNGLTLALFALAAALAVRVYAPLWIGRRQITRRQALGAHKYLVAERLILTTGFIAIYVPAAVALGLLAVALTVSLCSQIALRDRYEYQAITQSSVL